MAEKLKNLPGFRDFYPESCAERNYLFEKWRALAARYGFLEFEGPILESTELYTRKSGAEITSQLFCFEDRGEREVALRPELTPTLARMAAARQRDYKKPLRWFSIGPFFRYEKPQKGRTREFYQFNADILGEPSAAADAELIALSIDLMLSLGFTPEDFIIRLSDRGVWEQFIADQDIDPDRTQEFLAIIDKWERDKPEAIAEKLTAIGTSRETVDAFMKSPDTSSPNLDAVRANLEARGLADFVQVDLSVVRGLAYYTGSVYEVFDIKKSMRAVAGGGRYDSLLQLIGGADMPAAGFAVGDVVITDLIKSTPTANAALQEYLSAYGALDAYVVIAREEQRPAALGAIQKLRAAGLRIDYPLAPAKVNKQFQAAEQMNARATVLFGDEFPDIKIKDLAARSEQTVPETQMLAIVQQILTNNNQGPLLA
jgi:histidyl-tRNA synthetase